MTSCRATGQQRRGLGDANQNGECACRAGDGDRLVGLSINRVAMGLILNGEMHDTRFVAASRFEYWIGVA